MSVGGTARGLLELTRPVNAVAAGLLTFVGAFLTADPTAEAYPVTAAVVATVFGVAAGNAINDYFDRDIDAINEPDRPIPRGTVSPRSALAFSAVLFVAAVVLALTLPLLAIVIAMVNLAALVSYTTVFKGLPGAGNAVVAYLGGSTFLFGAAAVGTPGSPAIVLFVLAALSTIAREIVKDVEDLEGDREEGLNTLPIAIGSRRAVHVATLATVVAIVVSPLPYVQGALSVSYVVVLVPAVGLLAYATYRSYADPTTGQSLYKYAMFLAALAFVVGRIGPLS